LSFLIYFFLQLDELILVVRLEKKANLPFLQVFFKIVMMDLAFFIRA